MTSEENPHGIPPANGKPLNEALIGEAQRGPFCEMFSKVTVPPGIHTRYHQHVGNYEVYYILSGEAEYIDNGTRRRVKAGDVTYTADGEWHGFDNSGGKEPLVFIAVIIKTGAPAKE